jgi:hypothetical protein
MHVTSLLFSNHSTPSLLGTLLKTFKEKKKRNNKHFSILFTFVNYINMSLLIIVKVI